MVKGCESEMACEMNTTVPLRLNYDGIKIEHVGVAVASMQVI